MISGLYQPTGHRPGRVNGNAMNSHSGRMAIEISRECNENCQMVALENTNKKFSTYVRLRWQLYGWVIVLVIL
jgi:hypothetical protein